MTACAAPASTMRRTSVTDSICLGPRSMKSPTKMAVRSGLQEVELFAAAVIQAERLGVNLTKTLEVQAENMRERRRQMVKEQALKAPVKMLGPLVIFIFPPLFVVVLAPTLLSIMKNWGK